MDEIIKHAASELDECISNLVAANAEIARLFDLLVKIENSALVDDPTWSNEDRVSQVSHIAWLASIRNVRIPIKR